jgi:hypothetical protein
MEETIDFSSANVDDFKFAGQQEAAVEPASQPASEPAAAAEPVAEPVSKPAENASFDNPEPTPEKETAREYKFKDDFIKNVVEFYEKTGDITPYLQAKLVDFNSMSDEDVMRRNLREQYADLSDKAFDRLYKTQVVDKFKIDADEWGEEDSELGRELLKSEASKIRNQYLDWQNNFKAPDQEVVQESNDEAVEQLRRFEQEVKSNQYTKNLLEAKKISIKTSDGEFNYELPEANSLFDMTIDNDKFFSQFANPDGQLDYNRWYKTAAYSQNPEMFEKSLINYGKTLGRSEVTKEIKNPSTASVGDVPTESSGDFMTGLLQAFANRGVSK